MKQVSANSEVAIADELRRAIERSHALRTLGLAVGGLAVGGVLFTRGAPLPVWVLLVLYVVAWPHAAWLAVRGSAHPVATDERWLLADAGMIGFWVAAMQFNLIPSVLLVVLFAIAVVAIGGGRLLRRGAVVQVIACGVAAALNGFAFAPVTTAPEMLMSLPLMIVFPMLLSVIMHGLTQRVRRQNRVLREIGSLDCLSGLFNRRHWQAVVDAALARGQGEGAAMLLIDIDHFKYVNDQYGHTAGDEAITAIGAVIRRCVREGDLAGRYGGDEFGVVLRGTDMRVAEEVAERIRCQAARVLIERVPGLHCTLSIGIARGNAGMREAREWVEAADAALYRAKLSGRNRLARAG